MARAKLSSQESRVVIALMNQTNGYLREEDEILPSFWQVITLMSVESIHHTLSRLIKQGIVVTGKEERARYYHVAHPNEWSKSVFAPNR